MSKGERREDWPALGFVVVGFLGVSVLVGGFGVWAAMSQIGGAIVAQGRIEVERNRQVIQHPDGGVVQEILVREGQSISAGDVLVRLDATDLVSELAVVEGQLFEVLARRARLDAERDGVETLVFDPLLAESKNPVAAELMEGQQRLFEARLASARSEIEQLTKQKDQIADEIDGITAQEEALSIQLGFISEELTSQQSLLDRGLTAATRVLALSREKASLTGQSGELAAMRASSESRITELDIAILRIETDRREQALSTLRDLQFNEIELAERRRQILNQLDRLDIRAPVSGIVYDLRVFGARAVIRAAEPVLYIVPQDRPLVISAQVRPQDVDEVLLGQEVRIRLSAFNQRTTPELVGRVEQVSADAFTDEASLMSYYRARVALLDGETGRLPNGQTLIPGMPVEVFFNTSERTPVEFLLKPITDFFARSFRES
jgi:HlyD family type I secretion membrane fusion protein